MGPEFACQYKRQRLSAVDGIVRSLHGGHVEIWRLHRLLHCPANTVTDGAKRWELAIDLCLHGWHQGAIPRERFRKQLSDPWPPNERRRLAALRRQ
eukprot:4597387-Pyramimonas_sp.AAC.1